MNIPRKSHAVIQELLEAMNRQVTSYHAKVLPTGKSIAELIDGTAFFPGGTGLWRGEHNHGAIPEFFPDNPVMFLGHNFDSVRAHQAAQDRGGEASGQFWQRLLGILEGAKLSPHQCFFTNALMGLKSGSATGPMPRVPGYVNQCSRFLMDQVAIARPFAVVALGDNAENFLAAIDVPSMKSLHPSNWHFRDVATRQHRLHLQGTDIRQFLDSICK